MGFDEMLFQQQMEQALTCLRAVLEKEKNPQLLHDVPHQYEDKYAAAEFVTNTAIAAAVNALGHLGMGPEQLQQLLAWNKGRTVTLRFESHESCQHAREQTRDVESPTTTTTCVTEKTRTRSQATTSTTETLTCKVITRVTEHCWTFRVTWRVLAFQGNASDEALVLCTRTGHTELVTPTEVSPRPTSHVPPIDFQLTPLLTHLSADLQPMVKIDRWGANCHTPRRNPEVESLVSVFGNLSTWATAVSTYFLHSLLAAQPSPSIDLKALQAVGDVFVPVLPITFDTNGNKRRRTEAILTADPPAALPADTTNAPEGPPGLPELSDLNLCLGEQQRTLRAKLHEMASSLPAGEEEGMGLLTLPEARMVVVVTHLQHLCQRYSDAVDYVEDLLRRQLVAAVGRVVTPLDLTQYMELHYRRLFRDAFQPRPFCFTVRRPQHYPEGMVCLETDDGFGSAPQPVRTLCHVFDAESQSMHFPIDAATTVQCDGIHHVHAYVSHRFRGEGTAGCFSRLPRLQLTARARQFSSFLLLVGRITGADTFEPTYGCLLQNKDELRIPLDLEEIPTPKAFRDAIESLSAEQQRFAKAIRSLQLSSTLFGILIIQVKPQLERLLRLPADSLTKEIQLTQDLMELFMKYQVPSDLLTACSEGADVPPPDLAVEKVKDHVLALKTMLQQSRARELKAEAELREKVFGPPTAAGAILSTVGSVELAAARESNPQHRSNGSFRLRDRCSPQSAALPSSFCFGAPPSSSSQVRFDPSPPAGIFGGSLSGGVAGSGGGSGFGAAPVADPFAMWGNGGPSPQPSFGLVGNFPPPPETAALHQLHLHLQQQQQPQQLPQQQWQQFPPPPPSPAHTELTTPSHPKETVRIQLSEAEPPHHNDYTQLPVRLDQRFEQLDVDSALRPTILRPGGTWQLHSQDGLLSGMRVKNVGEEEKKGMRQQAMDLIDALSRSGTLALADTELHVVVAATHRFDQSLMDTVVQGNVNPIERLERSALIMASTIHDQPPALLLKALQQQRVREHSALLFE